MNLRLGQKIMTNNGYKIVHDNKVLYDENTDGFYTYKTWYEYDEDGRLIHKKNSEGEETIIDYDKGTVEEILNCATFTTSRIYDLKGNILYHKGTNGTETWYDGKDNIVKIKKGGAMNIKDKELLKKEVDVLLSKGYSFEDIYEVITQAAERDRFLSIISIKGDEYLTRTEKLPIDFIREYKDNFDWKAISTYQELTEDEIREFSDRVDWLTIFLKYDLSKELLYEFRYEIKKAVINSLNEEE